MNIFSGQPFTVGETALVYPEEALLKLMVFIPGGIKHSTHTTIQPTRGDQFRVDIHEIPPKSWIRQVIYGPGII
jgi:hypothetical protein